MKLQQLIYAVKVAECGSITEAARRLFVSQPSVTSAILDLEQEMNVRIFDRTNKGVVVSAEGDTFLGYARQVIEQAELLEGKYKSAKQRMPHFAVSCQHYSFAVNAFVDVIREFDAERYDFTLREEQTHEIIEDVARMKSELGVLYLSARNREVISKMLVANELAFEPLFRAEPHVFVCSDHPVAQRASVTLEDMASYPFLSYEQGNYNSFYFSEELTFHTRPQQEHPRARPRNAVQPAYRSEWLHRVFGCDQRRIERIFHCFGAVGYRRVYGSWRGNPQGHPTFPVRCGIPGGHQAPHPVSGCKSPWCCHTRRGLRSHPVSRGERGRRIGASRRGQGTGTVDSFGQSLPIPGHLIKRANLICSSWAGLLVLACWLPHSKGVGSNLMSCCHRLLLLQAQAFRYFTIAKHLRILFDVQ